MCSGVALRRDTFDDRAVHGAPFVALGAGVEGRTGEAPWMWLGWTAAAGVTVGHVVGPTDNAPMRR